MSKFTQVVLGLCTTSLVSLGAIQGVKYYQSLPGPVCHAQVIQDVNGNQVETPVIQKQKLHSSYEVSGEDLLEGLPDEAFSITKQGRNTYTFYLEVNGKVKYFMVYFSRTEHGYWISSMAELIGE